MEPLVIDPPILKRIVIHLIREELKSRRFFEGLRELGLDDAFYQVDLIEIIAAGVGLWPNSQDDYDFCVGVLTKHSARVNQDIQEIHNEARRVYITLRRHATNESWVEP